MLISLNNYVKININEDSFSIENINSKQDSALVSLKKVETLLKRENLGFEELTLLKEKSTAIYLRYYDKVDRLNPVEYFIAYWFGKMKKEMRNIDQTVSNIEFLIGREFSPVPGTPNLPCLELNSEVLRYLSLEDLARLSCVNRASKIFADVAFIERAREFGYMGNEVIGAKKHLQNLWKTKSIFTPHERIQMERRLRGVKTWNAPQLIDYLSGSTHPLTSGDACSWLQQFAPLLALRPYWDLSGEKEEEPAGPTLAETLGMGPIAPLPPPIISEHQKELHRLLTIAAALSDQNLVELLLDLGADPSLAHFSYRSTPLEQALLNAAKNFDFAIAIRLIEHGADINAPWLRANGPWLRAIDRELLTPLYYYCRLSPFNDRMVQFLLNHGANPSIPFVNGISYYPLQQAVIQGASEETLALIQEKLLLFQPNE